MQEERADNAPRTVTDDAARANPYELLMRQSRKLGRTATKTLDVTWKFIKNDTSRPKPKARKPAISPDRLLFGKKIAVKKADEPDIDEVVRRSHEVLATASTVILPVNIFPDTVTVDRTNITIIKRTFFWSADVISIRIDDILNVACSIGPLFGSLTISSRVMNSTDHFVINYFWRKDALYLKRIIQGYFTAQHDHIDTEHLGHDELINTLLELGSDSSS